MICSEIHETCGLPVPNPVDVLSKQSSETLATGAMRVATAMYPFQHLQLP